MAVSSPLLLVVGVLFCRVEGVAQTPGCGQRAPVTLSTPTSRDFAVVDPLLGESRRSYILYVPSGYDMLASVPVVFFFHGQWGDAEYDANHTRYNDEAELHGFIAVYPQGLSDGNCGTGWNVGSLNESGTCIALASSDSCCYDSCRELSVCDADGAAAHCAWSTCYNDTNFMSSLLLALSTDLCIDLGAIFATGQSNGGMLVHYLYAQLPSTFAAFVPVYGLPLIGFDSVPPGMAASRSIMSLHGRSDDVIPANGGLSAQVRTRGRVKTIPLCKTLLPAFRGGITLLLMMCMAIGHWQRGVRLYQHLFRLHTMDPPTGTCLAQSMRGVGLVVFCGAFMMESTAMTYQTWRR